MQVIDSEGYLKVKLIGGPVGPFVPYTGATANVDLGTHAIIAQNATISSSGSSDTATITHSSGSGIGLSITKGGNGEGLYVNKTSGSGNAVTVVGNLEATNLKRTGGTSSQFLKADGSVDSTTYITGITIGTTAIASGVVGRVLFEGAGNVVQQSSSLTYNDTTKAFTLSANQNALTSLTISNSDTGSSALIVSTLQSDTSVGNSLLYGSGRVNNSANQYQTGASYIIDYQGPVGLNICSTFASGANSGIRFWTASSTNNGVERMRIFATGNIGINTTTDAGFRLDVNGTARVQAKTYIGNSTQVSSAVWATSLVIGNDSFDKIITGYLGSSTNGAVIGAHSSALNAWANLNVVGNSIVFRRNGEVEAMRIASSSNILINTTTDAGFRLDVNGTARVGTSLTVGSAAQAGIINIARPDGAIMTTISSPDVCIINNGQGSGIRLNTDNVTYLHVRGFGSQFAANVTGALTSNAGFTRALLVNNVINANANNVELAAVYISPTFNNFAFTGVKNIAIQSASGGAHFNTTSVEVSSILQADSTTKGFLPPRMTTTQKNAIASPAAGLMVYDTTLTRPCFYDGTTWITL